MLIADGLYQVATISIFNVKIEYLVINLHFKCT